ncbi:hypothetical protein N9034_01400 [bacterium]|nr:hypothetical protein [bacterium]
MTLRFLDCRSLQVSRRTHAGQPHSEKSLDFTGHIVTFTTLD